MDVSYRARLPNGPPRDARFLRVVGRMKAGVTIEGAEARMQTLASGLASEHPDTNAGWSVRLVAARRRDVADEPARTAAGLRGDVLPAAAGVRQRRQPGHRPRARPDEEIAIRLALGAGGSRVRRQLIAESALSATVTAILAVLLTTWWVGMALSIAPTGIPRLHEVAMNGRVASFAAVLALVVTAIGNAVPTFRASRTPNCRCAQGRDAPSRRAPRAACGRRWWWPRSRRR